MPISGKILSGNENDASAGSGLADFEGKPASACPDSTIGEGHVKDKEPQKMKDRMNSK